jgi:hypothetical protein
MHNASFFFKLNLKNKYYAESSFNFGFDTILLC